MSLSGRGRELGQLRTTFDRAEASVVRITGLPGVGKTALAREAAADFRSVYHRAPPLSDPQQRRALAATLAGAGFPPPGGAEAGPTPGWEGIFRALVSGAPPGRPTVLVVDDAHRWSEARARFAPALASALARARTEGRAVHVALVAPEIPDGTVPETLEAPPVPLAPLPFRAAAPFLPGGGGPETLTAYAVFGGLPGILRLLDTGAALSTNVRRLVLAEGGQLRDAPLHLLERLFQTPTRYAAVLSALAPGEGDWGVVHGGVPDLTASGQAGPYLKRLEEVGLLEVRRSLDASPRTRSRRYRITDPFFSFWFRFVLPHRERLAEADPEALWAQSIRPGLAHQSAAALPQVCRDFMRHDAMEHLGAAARECGSLWGAGYDIPVAGVLATGAPFYGAPVDGAAPDSPSALARLDAQVRETRYGFGRERRIRLLFHGGEVPPALQREVARRDDVALLGPDALVGARP